MSTTDTTPTPWVTICTYIDDDPECEGTWVMVHRSRTDALHSATDEIVGANELEMGEGSPTPGYPEGSLTWSNMDDPYHGLVVTIAPFEFGRPYGPERG